MTGIVVASFEVETPYARSTGPALDRFFAALRDDRVIWGRRCDPCDRVVVPALDYCDTCGRDLGAWVRTGPDGVVTGIAVAHRPMPLCGVDPPFAIVRVRLDGAGTDLVHLAGDDLVRLAAAGRAHGARVRPRWAAERTGSIRDIERFETIPAEAGR